MDIAASDNWEEKYRISRDKRLRRRQRRRQTVMRTTDEYILWPRPNYGCKMWRAIITQYLVSVDTLHYDADANNTLLSGVDRIGNFCALGGGVGGSGVAFG